MLDNVMLWVHKKLWNLKRVDFYEDLADAIERKVALRDFLETQMRNSEMLKNDTGVAVYRHLLLRLTGGHGTTYRDLLASVVPRGDLMLLGAVDDSVNRKVEALLAVVKAIEFQNRSLKTLAFNLAMPAIIVPGVAILSYVMALTVKQIGNTAPPGVWEGFNGFVRWLSIFLLDNGLWVTLGVIALVSLFVYSLPRWTGNWRLKADNMFGYSLYRDYSAAVLLSMMSMMLTAGKTIKESVELLRQDASPWLRWQLNRILMSMQDNPNDYMAAFSRGVMPKNVRARLASLMDSAKAFDEVLVIIGNKEIGKLEARVKASAVSMNWSLVTIFLVLASVLSAGQMTIATAMNRESDPSRMMVRKAQEAQERQQSNTADGAPQR